MSELGSLGSLKSKMKDTFNFISFIKVSVKENEVPTEKKILVVQVFSLQRQVIYQIKAKRLNYLMKDFISSNFKRRLSFLLLNSEVSSLLLKLQPFRVLKYSLLFYCTWLTDKRLKKGMRIFAYVSY